MKKSFDYEIIDLNHSSSYHFGDIIVGFGSFTIYYISEYIYDITFDGRRHVFNENYYWLYYEHKSDLIDQLNKV